MFQTVGNRIMVWRMIAGVLTNHLSIAFIFRVNKALNESFPHLFASRFLYESCLCWLLPLLNHVFGYHLHLTGASFRARSDFKSFFYCFFLPWMYTGGVVSARQTNMNVIASWWEHRLFKEGNPKPGNTRQRRLMMTCCPNKHKCVLYELRVTF